MPNRLLRDWTDSDKVNILSVHAERFFTRLIMKVDDYGCFYADSRILKANLFPLLLDAIREADLLRWMAECQKAGLIVLYESNNKMYLQINDFNQRLRQKTLKFPLPSNDGHKTDIRQPELEEEVEKKLEVEGKENAATAGYDFSKNILVPKNQKEKKYISPGPEIEYPFGDQFLVIWGQWKEYKQREFQFKYKSPQSEQAALSELVGLAKGIEENAVKIINQSMAKGWKGFFELKNNHNGIAADKQPTGSAINTSSMVNRIMGNNHKAGHS